MMPKLRAKPRQLSPYRLSNRRKASGNLIAEFGPVLFILFVLALVPLINFIGVATGAVTAMLETNEAVSAAAVQEGYTNSLSAMYSTCQKFFAMGFARFTGLTPQNGYAACGMNLYIQTTPLSGKPTLQPIPNTPMSPPIDLNDNVYEFVGKNQVSIKPLISMENIPILGNVPGLGKPAFLELTATRMVEHPTGLAYNKSNSGDPAPQPFSRALTSALPPNASGYNFGWRDPTIFQQIEQAGQTVVSINVFVVQASNSTITSSGVTVTPGEKVWIDTQAVGMWNPMPEGTDANIDANGYVGAPIYPDLQYPQFSQASLVGQVGSSTPFLVGDDLFNFSPTGTGVLGMMMNDTAYTDNIGSQIVRVIVTD